MTTVTEPPAAAPAPAIANATGIATLHASSPQPLPFAPRQLVRAFLLERRAGNVLIYSNAEMTADADWFARLGGIERRYLGHWHEAMFDVAPAGQFAAPLFVHRAEAAETASRRPLRATFSRRHRFGDDLEVIPMPGHTPGSTAYLWDSGERRVLFTADSVYLDGGEWVAAVLGSSDRDAYVRSLERLAELEFDLLVPWAASADGPAVAAVEPGEGRERLLAIAERLRGGADR